MGLEKPIRADFFLYFPTAEGAARAAATLRNEGYSVETRLAADDTNWLALASREDPGRLSPGDLDAIEERMFALAAALGGDYDGFERDV